MRTPIYYPITYNKEEFSRLNEFLTDSQIGTTPCYIDLTSLSSEDLFNLLSELESSMRSHFISAKLPYPTFIITDKIEAHPYFPIVKKISDLPPYFDKRSKRLKAKEHVLLNKIELMLLKILNYDNNEIIEDLSSLRKYNRELLNVVYENNFYLTVLDHLKMGTSSVKKSTSFSGESNG